MSKIPIDAIPGQAETITALNAAGLSRASIGRYVGRSAWGVCLWLKRKDLWQPQRLPLTPEEKATIDDLYYEEGLTIRAIAEAVNRDDATVWSYLSRSGQHIPAYRWRTVAESERMADWYDRKIPIDTILSHFNISRPSFYERIRSCGREPNRRRPSPSTEEVTQMVELYAAKMPIDHIAVAVNRSRSTVVNALRRAGVYDRERSAATKPRRPRNHVWNRIKFGNYRR